MFRLFAVLPLFALCVPHAAAEEGADKAALRALSQAYAQNWQRQDEGALMDLFMPDVTVVPHHGADAIEGRDALRALWFPEDAPPTIVPEYALTLREIIVAGDMGVVRGRFRLVFEYAGTRTTIRGNGNRKNWSKGALACPMFWAWPRGTDPFVSAC